MPVLPADDEEGDDALVDTNADDHCTLGGPIFGAGWLNPGTRSVGKGVEAERGAKVSDASRLLKTLTRLLTPRFSGRFPRPCFILSSGPAYGNGTMASLTPPTLFSAAASEKARVDVEFGR